MFGFSFLQEELLALCSALQATLSLHSLSIYQPHLFIGTLSVVSKWLVVYCVPTIDASATMRRTCDALIGVSFELVVVTTVAALVDVNAFDYLPGNYQLFIAFLFLNTFILLPF